MLYSEEEIAAASELYLKIIAHLKNHYSPVRSLNDADLHLSTKEVHDKIQKLFPSTFYTAENIATAMQLCGFHFIEIGAMNFEWLLKRR